MLCGTAGDGDRGFGAFSMMIRVASANDIAIKFRPVSSPVRCRFVAQAKGVTGRANPHHRFAGTNEITNQLQLIRRKRSAANADQGQIGGLQDVETRQNAAVLSVAVNQTHLKILTEFVFSKLSQRHFSLILRLRCDDYDVLPRIVSKSKWFNSRDVRAGDRRTPVLFNVLCNKIIAGEV